MQPPYFPGQGPTQFRGMAAPQGPPFPTVSTPMATPFQHMPTPTMTPMPHGYTGTYKIYVSIETFIYYVE